MRSFIVAVVAVLASLSLSSVASAGHNPGAALCKNNQWIAAGFKSQGACIAQHNANDLSPSAFPGTVHIGQFVTLEVDALGKATSVTVVHGTSAELGESPNGTWCTYFTVEPAPGRQVEFVDFDPLTGIWGAEPTKTWDLTTYTDPAYPGPIDWITFTENADGTVSPRFVYYLAENVVC